MNPCVMQALSFILHQSQIITHVNVNAALSKRAYNVFLYRPYCTEIIVALWHGLQKLTTPARNFIQL